MTAETPDAAAARTLLRTLVETPSPSGEEAACSERLAAFFRAHGREVWIDDVGNVRAPGRHDVLVTSHVDTVPGDVPVRVDDGVLWGRGSVDAKGALAAMAVAAVRTDAAFAGVVGEETDSRGARHLIETRDAPAAVLNGEPSGWDNVTLGYRGSLPGTYLDASRSGHSSRPENNAIQNAIAWWSRVEAEFAADEWTPVTERVTPKPTRIAGALGDDGLAVEVTLDVHLRVPVGTSVEEVRERADGLLTAGTVRWHDAIPPVQIDHRTAAVRALRVAIREAGGEPTYLRKTGTSDMNLFAAAWDCPMATYGPGDSDLDHAPDERLSLDEFDRSVTVLESALRALTA